MVSPPQYNDEVFETNTGTGILSIKINNRDGQTILSSVVHFVSLGCSSQSFPLPFHRSFAINKEPLENEALFLFSQSSPVPSLRSVTLKCIHNTTSFRYLREHPFLYIPAV
jgi:hypothetical protein